MKTILVIEDDPLVRDSTIDILNAEGFSVLSAHNGRVGVEIACRELPDLIM